MRTTCRSGKACGAASATEGENGDTVFSNSELLLNVVLVGISRSDVVVVDLVEVGFEKKRADEAGARVVDETVKVCLSLKPVCKAFHWCNSCEKI